MAETYGGVLHGPHTRLDADSIRTAYARYAKSYDSWFGLISRPARRAAVAAINAHSGTRVLEVGVGTGLALPLYAPEKRITGIDLSRAMLSQAHERVAALGLTHVEALLEMDAQATAFAPESFDVAVAMFVASVVPDPRALLAELRRVVRPGGTILLVNHFAAESGPLWWAERALAPASRLLGWHPDIRMEHVMTPPELAAASWRRMWPMGLFRLVELAN